MTTPLNPKDAQQIAREVADNYFDNWHADLNKETLTTLILSSIKRAREEWLIEQDELATGAVAPAQPQPSKARKEQAPRAQGSPARQKQQFQEMGAGLAIPNTRATGGRRKKRCISNLSKTTIEP